MARRVHRMRKAAVSLSVLAILCGGVFTFGMFLGVPAAPNVVDEGFATVCYELPSDGSTPDQHTGIENIGYMNYRLRNQTAWYAEMHGKVKTTADQYIGTYKQYSDGVLIQTDIATSSLGITDSARQFCYVGDDVLWRSAAGGASSWATGYEGLASMKWKDTLDAHVTVADFTATRGLPGTSFSVYVLNEETVLSADEVVKNDGTASARDGVNLSAYIVNEDTLAGAGAVSVNGDGTYSQTFYLNPAQDKAPCHYVNQMVATGGLTSLPVFDDITVTYTFDSTWQVLSSVIHESYTAAIGMLHPHCEATYQTCYEYGSGKETTTVYHDYFEEFAKQEATGVPSGSGLTVLDCLASAFGCVITEPTSFDVQLTVGEKTVNGTVYVDINEMDIRAQFGAVTVWFDGENAYLALGKNRFRLSVEELTAMLPSDGDGASLEDMAGTLLPDLAEGEFVYDDVSASLSSELSLFGLTLPLRFEFALGENRTVSLDCVTAQIAYGGIAVDAALSFGEGSVPALENKEAFINAVPYIQTVADLFTADAISVQAVYDGGELAVDGSVLVDVNEKTAAGSFTLVYGELEKTVSVIYQEEYLYLALDGLKVKADVKKASSLLMQCLGIDAATASADVSELIEKVLSLDLQNLIAVSEADGALNVVLAGTQLLNAFGIQFETGDIALGVSQDKITANALGVALTVAKGNSFEVDTQNYADVTDALFDLFGIYNAKSVALGGELTLSAGDVCVSLTVTDGRISWQNGFELYLKLTADIQGTKQQIVLYASESSLKLAYGTVGVEVAFDDLGTLAEAFDSLIARIRGIVEQALEESNASLDEDLGTVGQLLSSLNIGSLLTKGVGELDFVSILNGLTIGAPVSENGLVALGYNGLTAELLGGFGDGSLALSLEYAGDAVSAEGYFAARVPEGDMPAMPDIGYLGTEGICELLDTVGAAVATLAQQCYTVSLEGTTKIVGADEDVLLYDVGAGISYYSGGSFPIRVDTENQSVVVNVGLYAHLTFAFVNRASEDDSVYLDFYVLDYNSDDELDFFLSLSRYAADHEKYAPLKLYATASDVMTVLSAGLSAFGVNGGIVNDYLVSKWLGAKTVAQLGAFGSSLISTLGLGDLLGGFAGMLSGSDESGSENADFIKYYVSSIESDGTHFSFTLNSSAVYGKEGLGNITFAATKTPAENGSLLTGISLSNVYHAEGTKVTNVSLSVSYEDFERQIPELTSDYFDLSSLGLGRLLTVLANSVTHSEAPADGEALSGEQSQPEYVLNHNFYIDGSVDMTITVASMINVNASVKIVALSVNVDQDGLVGINIRLEYDGVQKAGYVAINGDSAVDVTIKDGMVYMKRTQYSYFQKGTISTDEVTYTNPIIIYRAMPLEAFFGDIVNQLSFILNFGDLINGYLPSGDETDDTPAETVDYGTAFKNVLSGYAFGGTEAEGYTWTFTLNGSELTGGVMKNIVISLKTAGSGEDMVIRTLTVDTGINAGVSDSLVNIPMTATLVYRNPRGVMDEGVTDLTHDVAEEAAEKMSYKLAAVNWDETKYVQGGVTTVTYVFNGAVAGSQEVVYDPVTGECFTRLSYPDLSDAPQETGYSPVWKAPAKIEGSGTTVYASYQPNVYTVTLVSDRAAENFVYDEASGVWKQIIEYTYNTTVGLPVGYTPDGAVRIAAFVSGEDSYSELYNVTSDLTLTAVWEEIEYTVTYVANGETVSVQTAHYGEAFNLPAAPEKTGYDFVKWELSGETVTGNVTVEAVYRAKHYTVTLVSEYALEGYAYSEEVGAYVKEVEYVYGSAVALDWGRGLREGFFLDGFTVAGGETVYKEIPEAVIDSLVLTAKWSELGYDIAFYAEEVLVDTLNLHAGDTIANLPAVPVKTGYTGTWNIPEGYVVTGNDTVSATYTPNVYTVTVISNERTEGFTPSDDGAYWYKAYPYTYDGDTVTLDPSVDIPCFDFGGYFTKPGGAGDEIKEIDNETALAYGTLYVYWIDNTVTVTLSSEVAFDGYEDYSVADGYYKRLTFNDTYTLTEAVAASGFKQFGWWAQVGGVWARVTDVKELNGKQIWAAWLQDNVTVTIESASSPSARWSISGTYTYTWYGQKSQEIIESIDDTMSKTEEALYAIYGKLGSSFWTKTGIDILNGGDWHKDGSFDGSFAVNQLPSTTASVTKAGAKVRLTFAFEDLSITIESADYAWKNV